MLYFLNEQLIEFEKNVIKHNLNLSAKMNIYQNLLLSKTDKGAFEAIVRSLDQAPEGALYTMGCMIHLKPIF